MSTRSTTRGGPSLIGWLRRYRADASGVAAIEFGLIAPFLLLLFLGGIEYARATMFARRFNLVTAMASDLVARELLLDDADLRGIERAIDTVWGTYDNKETLRLQILHLRRASSLATRKSPGTSYVEWSYGIYGAPTVPACQNHPLPAPDMITNGNSLVLVNGTYTYRTLFGVQAPGITSANWSWATSSSHAPRDLCVAYGKPNCLSTCE